MFGFRVLGFRVSGLGFSEFRVLGFRTGKGRVRDLGSVLICFGYSIRFRVQGLRV